MHCGCATGPCTRQTLKHFYSFLGPYINSCGCATGPCTRLRVLARRLQMTQVDIPWLRADLALHAAARVGLKLRQLGHDALVRLSYPAHTHKRIRVSAQ